MGGDSLDDVRIEIDAKADSAKNTVDELIERLEVLQNGLKGFDGKGMKSALDNLRKTTSGIKEKLEPLTEFEKKLNGLGRNIKTADSMEGLQKQIAQAETRLDSLLSKENKMRTVGGIDENTKSFRNMQYDIAEVCGQLDTLYAKLEQIQKERPLNFWEKPEWTEQPDTDNQEPQSFLEYAADNVKQSFADIQETAAPVADSVRHIGEEMRSVGAETDNARQKIESMGNGGGFARLMDQLRSFSASDVFGRMSAAVRDFQTRIGTRIPTEQYTELAANIRQAEMELQRLLDKQDRMEAQGVSQNSASWRGLQYDIRVATDRVAEFNRDMELLKASGGDSQHLSGLSYAFKGIANGAESALKTVSGAVKTIISKFVGATKGILKMGTSIQSNYEMFGKFSSAVKKCGMVLGGFVSKLKSVVKLFAFMLLRKAITAIFEGLGMAIQHLAQKSASVNEQISTLISSCQYLSHQIAALASPLLDIFGPALTRIIDLLAKATAYINQFLSALTGKKVYTSAIKQNVDYAAGLADVGSAAKKAAKEIRDATVGIDELNIISPNDDDNGGGGAADLEDCYEELAINQKILDLVQKLKDLLTELFQPMQQAWDDYGQGVIDAFKYALSSCKKLIVDMAKTWKEVWLNGSGYELCSNILLLLTSMLNWIGDIATAWDAAWQVKGYAYVQSVFDKMNAVLSLIYTISESFRNAFNSGFGQEMIEHIYQIFTDLNYVVVNLVNGLKRAWQEARTGDEIAKAILDIINVILGSIEKITSSTREWAKNLNLSPLLTSIKNLLEKVKPLIEKIGDALSWAWENMLLPLGKWAVESAIPKVIDAISAAFEALDAILEVLKPVFKWIWDHMLEPLAKWTGGTIVEIIDGISTAFKGISEVFKKIADGEDWGSIGKYIWEGLINGIKNVGSWIWEKLTDAFWGIVDFVKELFGIHSPSTVFAEIGGFLIDGLLQGIADTWESIVGFFSGGLNGIKETFSSAWGSIKSNTSSAWENIKGNFSVSLEKIKNNTSTAWESVKSSFSSSWENVISGVKNSWNSIVMNFSDSWRTITNNVTAAWNEIKSQFTAAWNAIVTQVKNSWLTITQNFTSAWTTIKNGVTQSWNEIKSQFTAAWNAIVTQVKNSWLTIAQNFTSAWTTIKNGVTQSWNEIKNAFSSAWAAITKGVSESWTNIKNAFSNGFNSVLTAVKNGWENIKNTFANGISNIKSAITSIDWTSLGSNIINGIWNGISSGWSWLTDKVKSLANSLLDAAKDALGIHSPSRRFAEIGAYIVAGLNQGLDREAGTTTEHINSWIGKLTDIQVNLSTKFNVSEELGKYKANLDSGITQSTILRTVQEKINSEGNIQATLESSGGIKEAFSEVMQEVLTPWLDEIRNNTQRTASNTEGGFKAVVEVDGHELIRAEERAKSGNGYSFTPAPA